MSSLFFQGLQRATLPRQLWDGRLESLGRLCTFLQWHWNPKSSNHQGSAVVAKLFVKLFCWDVKGNWDQTYPSFSLGKWGLPFNSAQCLQCTSFSKRKSLKSADQVSICSFVQCNGRLFSMQMPSLGKGSGFGRTQCVLHAYAYLCLLASCMVLMWHILSTAWHSYSMLFAVALGTAGGQKRWKSLWRDGGAETLQQDLRRLQAGQERRGQQHEIKKGGETMWKNVNLDFNNSLKTE